MGAYRRDNQHQINAFEIGEIYLFKYYFEEEDVFARLKQYYNNHEYRFEVPATDFAEIQDFLNEYGYELNPVADTEAYIVVIEKYTAHPEDIFKKSVSNTGVKGYNCFLMKDQSAVEDILKEGGLRLTDMLIENPFTPK